MGLGAFITAAAAVSLASATAEMAAAGAAGAEQLPTAQLGPESQPSVEDVEELMAMFDHLPDGEDMPEHERRAHVEGYLRLMDGRTGPIWEEHSHAERTANLQQHHARRLEERRQDAAAASRRRAQMGASKFAGASEQEMDSSLAAVLDPAGLTCLDALAANTGRPLPCTYDDDCSALRNEYFPEPQSQTTRCFLFDPSTETWPEAGGQGQELLGLREQRFEVHTYASSDEGTNLAGDVSFSVGKGRVCQEVTIVSSLLDSGDSHTEVVCLLDGEHEYNHTVTERHSVEVVGYTESEVYAEAGGITRFVVGECTDVLLRVTTTADAGPITWSIDDEGHNGPWTFDLPGAAGVEEFESCMFDNDFTLSRQGGAGWQGSVEVVGFIHYHNTITIPNDENWIVQGAVDPSTGLPSNLDGRLKSGSAVDRSHANIVLRDMRISNQVAPVDVNPIGRNGGRAGMVDGFGGAFEYDGGSSDQSDLVQIIFERVVFDHNRAQNGGGVDIDGRAGYGDVQEWESGIALTILACTFFRNFASSYSGGLAVFDVWPLRAVTESSDFLHNEARFMSQENYYNQPFLGPERRAGTTSYTTTDCHYDGGYREGLVVVGMFTWFGVNGGAPDEPDALWIRTVTNTHYTDHASWVAPGVVNVVWPNAAGKQLRLDTTFEDSSISGNIALGSNSRLDGIYLFVWPNVGFFRASRARFERSGNFQDGAVGTAGSQLVGPVGDASVSSAFEFSETEWFENSAGTGGAIYVALGLSDVRLWRCVLRGNQAKLSGGAISFQGVPSATLLVEFTLFERNAVRLRTDGQGVDVTVLLNSGGIGLGTSLDEEGQYTAPIWRIDDGPVYGISWQLCQGAMQQAVTEGLPESWPSGLSCANITYNGPRASYSHILTLAEGAHTLWTGVVSMSRQRSRGWLGGKLEIASLVGPVFPNPLDNRVEAFPGCGPGAGCNPETQLCCPMGLAFWSSQEFRVASGEGGAVVASGEVAITIVDSVLRSNEAPKGASLSLTATARVAVSNTTIDEPVDAWSSSVSTVGATVDSCLENPCEQGSRCTFRDHSTFCDACGRNEMGADGISCAACQPGTQPDASHTLCLPCEPGQFSQIGICSSCAAGKTSSDDRTVCVPCGPGTYSADGLDCKLCPAGSQPNADKTGCDSCTLSGQFAYSLDGQECHDCPARHAPNYERTDCFCQTNTYSALELGGVVTCLGTSFRSDGMDTDECAVCPACLDCDVVGQTTLKSGWAFFGARQAYRCPGAGKFDACPPLLLDDNATVDSSTCAVGYEGPVCGNCQAEYNHLKVGNPCLPCDDGVINLPLVMGLFFGTMVAGGAIISGVVGILQDNGVITDLRILVGFYQILGQASNVLDLSFPHPVPDLVSFIKLLFLDVRRVVMLDCWDIGGFYGKLVTNIVVVPTFIVSVCYLIYMSQKRTLTAVIAAGAADESGLHALKVKLKQNLFVGIFLVYPTITTTLFRVPQCKYFGEAGFHEDDFTIDCTTTKFALTVALSAFVILLIPIGVPVVFLILMRRAKQANGGTVNATALGGAKLVADDADDESDTYGFLIRDYRPQYWYHEIVTYFRKLMLGGISVVMGRGTIAQTYFVISIEAFFQMHHMRTYPFVVYKHNVMEALGHCALMLLYAISLILRNDDEDTWDAEWFPKEGYGWFIVFLFAIVLPSPTVYFYCRDKDGPSSGAELGEGFEENPLAIELGQADVEDKEGDAETQQAQPARAKLAKMQREGKDARAQVQKLQIETQQQQAEIQQLHEEVQQQQQEIQQLEAQGQLDGDAVRKSESALRKEVATLKAQLVAISSSAAGTQLATLPESAAPPHHAAPVGGQAQEAAMKELAADESLSEEARESAKKAFEVLLSSQLLDIEQTAALNKIESEAQFVNKQAQIERTAEQDAELEKLESEAMFQVKKLESAAQTKRKKVDAKKRLQEAEGLGEEMTEWLRVNRLQSCAVDICRFAGEDVMPDDLQYLTEENIEEIGSAMTHVEKMRLQAAVQALRGE